MNLAPLVSTVSASTIGLTVLLSPPNPHALTPVCDAGGPYAGECTSPITSVQLDASGSFDPGGLPLQFLWDTNCSGGFFDDPTSPMATLFHPNSSCSEVCTVALLVTSASGSDSCAAMVVFEDTTAPVITCPEDTFVPTGQPFGPAVTGFASAADSCNPAPAITWSDEFTEIDQSGIVLVTRTWVADDGCLTSTCKQKIKIAPFLSAHVDMYPVECPNVFVLNRFSLEDTVPAAVLGNDFDPGEVAPGSLGMGLGSNMDESGGTVDFIQPVQISIADTGTPFVGPVCDCHAVGPDGIQDLNMRFSKNQMLFGLGLINEPPGTLVEIEIKGLLLDGTPFKGTDCVLIQ